MARRALTEISSRGHEQIDVVNPATALVRSEVVRSEVERAHGPTRMRENSHPTLKDVGAQAPRALAPAQRALAIALDIDARFLDAEAWARPEARARPWPKTSL